MHRVLKTLASKLPSIWQQELKRYYFARKIRKGTFGSNEREFKLLHTWIGPGDWVLDIGANVGYYTSRMSDLVGETGRVIAFEPVPQSYELLAANSVRFRHGNVSLLNIAASDSTKVVGMEIPRFDTGLDNFYMAHLTEKDSGLQVLCMAVDDFTLADRVRLVKIDAEGHELPVLKGMEQLLKRDLPTLIVEDNSPEIEPYLRGLGYLSHHYVGSSNRVYEREAA